MNKYFPEHFGIAPRSFVMPQDIESLLLAMNTSENYFIAKPTNGSQGTGILLIKNKEDLKNWNGKPLNEYIVQEYISRPLLINNKKFDLRLYVLITSISPFIAYLNTEGLARFCTEDYQRPTRVNISHGNMHLTNYSLNKKNPKFIHTSELFLPNEGTKQTLTSLYSALAESGRNVTRIQKKIRVIIMKTLISIQPSLEIFYMSSLCSKNAKKVNSFQIIGIDILLDRCCHPWLLEINANPSLRVDHEEQVTPWVTRRIPSPIDYHVKSSVMEHAIFLSQIPIAIQLSLKACQTYQRVLPCTNDFMCCLDFFSKIKSLFIRLTDSPSSPLISGSKFMTLYDNIKLSHPFLLKSELDILFHKATRRLGFRKLDFLGFIHILEELCKKLLPNQSLESSMHTILSRLLG